MPLTNEEAVVLIWGLARRMSAEQLAAAVADMEAMPLGESEPAAKLLAVLSEHAQRQPPRGN